MTDLASSLRPAAARGGGKAAGVPTPGIAAVVALVADKLTRVEEDCRRNLRSEVGVIDELGSYLAEAGGKRIRPVMLLLAAQMCGYRGDRDVLFASVFEFIHTATLVHDDVIDQADLRRGRGSINAQWGNGLTVLLGDYLYIKSMNMALVADDIRIIKILAQITLKMIEGEIIADRRRGQIGITEDEYLEIVRRKTAHLFAGCGRVAGVLSDAAPERVEALAEYGLNLGMAFQIVDDLLDFTSERRVLGKPVASDLKEGKLTLPLIHFLERAGPKERALVSAVLEKRDFVTVAREEIVGQLRAAGAFERSRQVATLFAQKARGALGLLPVGPARDALLALPEFVVARDH